MYPLNGNNPQNLLVANQFNPESFQVVQQVYYSLEHLRVIYKHLHLVQQIGSQVYRLEAIEPYLADISEVSMNLSKLLDLNSNVPFLVDIQPRVKQFVTDLDEIKNKLSVFDDKFHEVLGLMETNTKHLEDLFAQYEQGLHCILQEYKDELCSVHQANMQESIELHNQSLELYEEMRLAMPLVHQALEYHNKDRALLVHLSASDLVTLAVFNSSEVSMSMALNAIKESEKYGNDESINRYRLQYKLPDNNVFDVMDANRERLAREGEVQMVLPVTEEVPECILPKKQGEYVPE